MEDLQSADEIGNYSATGKIIDTLCEKNTKHEITQLPGRSLTQSVRRIQNRKLVSWPEDH